MRGKQGGGREKEWIEVDDDEEEERRRVELRPFPTRKRKIL